MYSISAIGTTNRPFKEKSIHWSYHSKRSQSTVYPPRWHLQKQHRQHHLWNRSHSKNQGGPYSSCISCVSDKLRRRVLTIIVEGERKISPLESLLSMHSANAGPKDSKLLSSSQAVKTPSVPTVPKKASKASAPVVAVARPVTVYTSAVTAGTGQKPSMISGSDPFPLFALRTLLSRAGIVLLASLEFAYSAPSLFLGDVFKSSLASPKYELNISRCKMKWNWHDQTQTKLKQNVIYLFELDLEFPIWTYQKWMAWSPWQACHLGGVLW